MTDLQFGDSLVVKRAEQFTMMKLFFLLSKFINSSAKKEKKEEEGYSL